MFQKIIFNFFSNDHDNNRKEWFFMFFKFSLYFLLVFLPLFIFFTCFFTFIYFFVYFSKLH